MQVRKISFKTKLILFLEIFLITISTIVGIIFWQELSFQVRETSRLRLMAIASTAAAMTEVAKHELIQTEEDEDTENYLAVQAVYKKIVEANEGIDDIYTLRRTSEDNKWQFVVGAKDTSDINHNGTIELEEERVAVGEEFSVADYPEMQKAFFGSAADYETSCDKWGCWLSGYAPLIDENGYSVAIVGVDVAADGILSFERKVKAVLLLTFFLIAIIFSLLLYFMLRIILTPISQIVEGIGLFSSNLSSRLVIKTGDEFEIIASTFNMMAGELEKSYREMETRVKEKTSALADKVIEAHHEKAKDEALLASIGEGMAAVDYTGKIIMLNDQTQTMLGIDKEKVLGKIWDEVIRMEDEKGKVLPTEKRPMKLCLKLGEKIETASYYYIRSDGTKFPALITAAPVKLNKKIIGSIIVFRDITEEKRIDQTKSEFVSLASHQLRTPLSSISWYAEMLLDGDGGKLTKKQKLFLEKIYDAQSKMEDLVSAFLSVSRIEMGTFVINLRPIDFSSIMEEVLEELKESITQKKLTITKNYEENLTHIPADRQLVRIIFQNLLTNAIKYTPPSGKISIKMALDKKTNKDLVVEISDTGYGIPKYQQGKLYTKLFRADNVKEKETEGTGLGLYIVKSIIDNSGGSIRFVSEENKGTTFFVKYPLAGMHKKNSSEDFS